MTTSVQLACIVRIRFRLTLIRFCQNLRPDPGDSIRSFDMSLDLEVSNEFALYLISRSYFMGPLVRFKVDIALRLTRCEHEDVTIEILK